MQGVFSMPEWKRLPASAQATWLTMATYVDPNKGNIYYGGHKKLAKAMGKHLTAVPRAIKTLITAGLLEVVCPGGAFTRSEYRLVLPMPASDAKVQRGVRENAETPLQNYSLKRKQKLTEENMRDNVPQTPYAETEASPTAQPRTGEILRVQGEQGYAIDSDPGDPGESDSGDPGSETARVLVEAAQQQTLPGVVELLFDKHLEPAFVPPKPSHNAETRRSEEEAETEEAGERFLDKEDGITPEMRAARGPMADLDAILQTKPDKGREGT